MNIPNEEEMASSGYEIHMNDDGASCVVYHDGGWIAGTFWWRDQAVEWIKLHMNGQFPDA